MIGTEVTPLHFNSLTCQILRKIMHIAANSVNVSVATNRSHVALRRGYTAAHGRKF